MNFDSFQIKWKTLIFLLILVPIGLFTRYYHWRAADFVNYSLGGVVYVIFWCLLCSLLLPAARPWKVCVWVLTVTSLLECLQLWHPPWLELLRSSMAGQLLLGTTFVWTDFLGYLAGAGIAWAWLSKADQTEP